VQILSTKKDTRVMQHYAGAADMERFEEVEDNRFGHEIAIEEDYGTEEGTNTISEEKPTASERREAEFSPY